jgi:hypothetical protein
VAPQEERRRVSAVDLIYDYVLELFYGVMCEYCMENGDDVHVVGRCADCRQEEKPTRMKRFRMTRKIVLYQKLANPDLTQHVKKTETRILTHLEKKKK